MSRRIKYAFIIFALLDAVSFLRGFTFLEIIIQSDLHLHSLLIARVVLVVSFLGSAILFALRKKLAFIIYFTQFSLRLLFMMLSFGFLLEVFGLDLKSMLYLVVLYVAIALEFLRLLYSIFIFRKMKK